MLFCQLSRIQLSSREKAQLADDSVDGTLQVIGDRWMPGRHNLGSGEVWPADHALYSRESLSDSARLSQLKPWSHRIPRWLLQSLRVPFCKMGTISDSPRDNGICSSFQKSRIKGIITFVDVSSRSLQVDGVFVGTGFPRFSNRKFNSNSDSVRSSRETAL